jgi:hypothetical protein
MKDLLLIGLLLSGGLSFMAVGILGTSRLWFSGGVILLALYVWRAPMRYVAVCYRAGRSSCQDAIPETSGQHCVFKKRVKTVLFHERIRAAK